MRWRRGLAIGTCARGAESRGTGVLRLVRTDVNSAAVKAAELGEAWLAHGHEQIGRSGLTGHGGWIRRRSTKCRRGRHAR